MKMPASKFTLLLHLTESLKCDAFINLFIDVTKTNDIVYIS